MLEGQLGDFSLPDIFQLIALTKKSGVLTVAAPETTGRVLFRGGEVCFAVPDVQRMALGSRLVAAGLASEEQVREILEESQGQGNLTERLIERAVVDEGALDQFIRSQIEDAIFDLMRLDNASFSFDGTDDTENATGLTLSTDHLIMEGGRRMAEWTSIREQLPSSHCVLALVPDATSGAEFTVSADEWRILAVVDGRRTVAEIVELVGREEFTTSKALCDLVGKGLVAVGEPDASEGPVPDAVAEMMRRRDSLRRLEELELGGQGAPEQPAEPKQPAEQNQPAQQEQPAEQDAKLRAEVSPARDESGQQEGPASGVGELASMALEAEESSKNGAPVNGARRLTRDEDVNKGLLLRLIDGVKEA